ncbi:MAG: hypothetical protein ACPGAN_05435 [Candidatus Poseidoniaceae archaeon]
MTEGNRKSHNPFSKIVGELRQKKEKLIKDNEQEYQDRLEQAEEILVGDCFEAIAGITPQAYMKSGKVSFESEAFLWFKDGKKNLMGEVEDPTVEVVKKIASGALKKVRAPANSKVFNPLASPAPIKFYNNDLHDIFRKVRNHLSQEKFVLETNDGIEFTLLWSTG